MIRVIAILAVLSGGVLATVERLVSAVDPDVLWTMVHNRCVPDQRQHGSPAPCAKVELGMGKAGGYAVLKDLRGAAQYLLIPTIRIEGIESPILQEPGVRNYWLDAWNMRGFMAVSLRKPVPDDDIGLAINSKYGRSQNQLHIHIDCLRGDVKRALRRADPQITPFWSAFRLQLAGQDYSILRMPMDALTRTDPFKLLASTDASAKADMARQTLALVGAVFPDGSQGFYLLKGTAKPEATDLGSSEQILDHDCSILRKR